MGIDAKTIQIFLPEGEPRGLRIAEITTRIVQAVQVPRTHLDSFLNRAEASRGAVYFLFGATEDQAKPIVYIGQTEDLYARLRAHNANKEFWNAAVLIQARTETFTLTHLKYLEWQSIQAAAEAKRYHLDNGNAGSKPHIPEPLEADCVDAFETASILLSTLGFPVFEPPAGAGKKSERQVFYCRGPHAEARGAMVEDGFVVFAGAKTRRKPVPSAKSFEPWLEKLAESGVLEASNENEYRLTQDYVFTSPSYAAAFVLARTANGWIEWKREDGSTLHDVYRADAAPQTKE